MANRKIHQADIYHSRLDTVVGSALTSKLHLGDYISTVSPRRVEQILARIRFLQRLFFSR